MLHGSIAQMILSAAGIECLSVGQFLAVKRANLSALCCTVWISMNDKLDGRKVDVSSRDRYTRVPFLLFDYLPPSKHQNKQ